VKQGHRNESPYSTRAKVILEEVGVFIASLLRWPTTGSAGRHSWLYGRKCEMKATICGFGLLALVLRQEKAQGSYCYKPIYSWRNLDQLKVIFEGRNWTSEQ
jgi:hypothetical protein